MDPGFYRTVMGRFATGVTVITCLADGRPAGMTANAFMSVSLEPPLVVTSIRHQSRLNQWIGEGMAFGINVLAEQQFELCRRFAGKDADASEVPFTYQQGVPLIAECLAQLVVRARQVIRAGDHLLYVSEIQYARLGHQRRPLIFFTGGFRQLHAHTPVINWATEAESS